MGNTGRTLGAALGAAGLCRNPRVTLTMETPEKTNIRQTSERDAPQVTNLRLRKTAPSLTR